MISGQLVVRKSSDNVSQLELFVIFMKPTYEELTNLNPRLRSKSREEIESLANVILEHGYVWQSDKSLFYNPKFEVSVRTGGLDMFTAENFKESQKTILDPENIKTSKALRANVKQQLKVRFIFFLLSMFSFIFINWKLGILFLFIMMIFWIYMSKRRSKKV